MTSVAGMAAAVVRKGFTPAIHFAFTHEQDDVRTSGRLAPCLRDKPYQANRTLGALSKMFSLAEAWGWRPDGSNPCRHVKRYKEHKRERFLSPEETERLGQVLREAEEEMPLAVPA